MLSEFQQQVAQLLSLSEKEITPLTQEEKGKVYAKAYELYAEGSYRKAAKLFTQLVLLDPFSLPFWKGLASCKQMAKEYEAALHAWSLSALLNEEDPLPHFHAAECYLHLEEKKEANAALSAAEERAHSNLELKEKIKKLYPLCL